jgi:xanthine dehydrogenase accessory factor
MRELLTTIDTWRAEGRGFGRAVLVRAFGNGPRPEGATLLVADDGSIAGSVSGGCVEGAAAELIHEARASGQPRVVRFGISDEQAWGVGLACGSTIDVLIEPELRDEVEQAARARAGSYVVTPLPRGEVDDAGDDLDAGVARAAAELLARGRSGTVTTGDREYFVETFAPPQRIVIFGAIQTAIPLVRMAHDMGWRTVVTDARASFATIDRFPEADEVVVGWPDEIASHVGLGPDDAVAIMTHDPKLDEPAILEALRAGCRYVGTMGSKKTQAGRRERLRAAGVSEEDLGRLRGPIGLDLGGREPPEMALAILAEIVAARNDAPGTPLSQRARAAAAAAEAVDFAEEAAAAIS